MNAKLKAIVLVCVAIMLVAMLPLGASAATSGSCGDNVTWSIDSNRVLTISGNGPMDDYSFWAFTPWFGQTISQVVIENGVTSIGDNAFYQQTYLTKVKMAKSVTSIGEGAFSACQSLTSVEMSANVTIIGNDAFSNCSSLESISMPSKLVTIGDFAFYYTSIGGDIRLPNSVRTIGEYAFSDTAITSITVSEGVTALESNVFGSCENLTKVVLPGSVTSIHVYAFSGTDDITIHAPIYSEAEYYAKSHSIPFVSTGKEAPDYVFSEGEFAGMSYSLTGHGVLTLTGEGYIDKEWTLRPETVRKIVLSEGITGIMGSFTDEMESLEELTIPYTTVYIGIRLPSTVTTIRGYTNSDAQTYATKKKLKFVSLGTTPFYTLSEGTLDNISWKLTSDGLLVITGEGALTSAVTRAIDVFCAKIKDVRIGEGITEIGKNVFVNVKYGYINGNIKTITTPSTLKVVDNVWIDSDETPTIYCYKYSAMGDLCEDSSYTYEFIGESPVWEMDNGTYSDNITWRIDNHRNLVIEGAGEIPAGSPGWNKHLKKVVTITLSPDIYLIGKDTLKRVYTSGNGNNWVSLGELTTIYGYTNSIAHTMAKRLGVTFVSKGVLDTRFEILSGDLTDTISYSLDSLGRLEITGTGATPDYSISGNPWSGYDYSPVKEIIISDGITYLGSFLCSSGARDITIGNSVEGIGSYCFYDTLIQSLVLPDTLTSIGTGAFQYCSALVSIKIPDSVTVIGDGAFYYTSSLKWVWLSEGMEAIGKNTFYLSGIKYIYIPKSIKQIDQTAFRNSSPEHIYYNGNPAYWSTSVEGSSNLSSIQKSYTAELDGITATYKSDDGVVVKALLNSDKLAKKDKMYAATYKDGAMTAIVPITASGDYLIEAECDTIRVFFWSFEGGYEPKCYMYERLF